MELEDILQIIRQHTGHSAGSPGEPGGRGPSQQRPASPGGRGPSPPGEHGGSENASAASCRTGRTRVQSRLGRGLAAVNRKRRRRSRLQRRRESQLDQQARSFNQSGRARTRDFEFPTHDGQLQRGKTKGKGAWKTWTPGADLRSAFSSANTAARTTHEQLEGASGAHAGQARMVAAECILQRQALGVKKALHSDCKLCIQNLMFDESGFQLKLESRQPLTDCSVLCSHGQLTYELADGRVMDEHIARPPRLLPGMNWATLWSALQDGLIAECEASFVATLTSCDAHAANIKMLRFLEHTLPDEHFLLPVLCAQHRTGNVIEQLTKLLGVLGGNFSTTKTMSKQNLLQSLRQKVRDRVQGDLRVLAETPAAALEEWRAGKDMARKLVELCCFQAPEEGRPGSQRDNFAKLLDFFSSPWTGLCFAKTGRMLRLSRAVRMFGVLQILPLFIHKSCILTICIVTLFREVSLLAAPSKSCWHHPLGSSAQGLHCAQGHSSR